MYAMVLKEPRTALEWLELPDPVPGPGQVRIRVAACGVCRTDLHVIDGELPDPLLPVIPGHQIVGVVRLQSCLLACDFDRAAEAAQFVDQAARLLDRLHEPVLRMREVARRTIEMRIRCIQKWIPARKWSS